MAGLLLLLLMPAAAAGEETAPSRPSLRVLSLWRTQTPLGLPSFFKDPRFLAQGPVAEIPLYRIRLSNEPAGRLVRFVEIFIDDLKLPGPGNTRIRLKLALR